MEILGHFSTNVVRALEEIEPNYEHFDGLVVCGTHSPKDLNLEEIIEKIRQAREKGKPFLGICFGHQLAAIEYARNVLGNVHATSEEFGEEGDFIVYKLPKLKVGLYRTNRMRLDSEEESYWNNYEVREEFLSMWNKPEHFISVQYHPEYQSSKDKPHKVLTQFIALCKKN